MNAFGLSFIFAIGGATFVFAYLARKNGNADAKMNTIIAVVAGIIVFLFWVSLLKLVLRLN